MMKELKDEDCDADADDDGNDADADDDGDDADDDGDNVVVLLKEGKERRRGRSIGENKAWTTRLCLTSL